MAQQKSNKKLVNLFDLIALGIIVFVSVFFALSYFYTSSSNGKPMAVTVKVTSDDKAIYDTAQKQQQVYLNSSNQLFAVKDVNYQDGNLMITVRGDGKIKGNNIEFGGQRILIGQKAEIHGNYFAQGIITNIAYEN